MSTFHKTNLNETKGGLTCKHNNRMEECHSIYNLAFVFCILTSWGCRPASVCSRLLLLLTVSVPNEKLMVSSILLTSFPNLPFSERHSMVGIPYGYEKYHRHTRHIKTTCCEVTVETVGITLGMGGLEE